MDIGRRMARIGVMSGPVGVRRRSREFEILKRAISP
jgi:hypothetical protein